MSSSSSTTATFLEGGCHCGAVRYRVKVLELPLALIDCDCTVCTKKGFLHYTVPASRFELLSGEAELETYSFLTHIAKHHFCGVCGVHSYYVPRSNPDGFSINARCFDTWQEVKQTASIEPFDGLNWGDNAKALAHLSQD